MTTPKPNPKAILPVVLLVAVVVGGGLWWRNHQLAVLAATQIRGNGTIEADEVEVASQRPARLARYDVAEGQSVHQEGVRQAEASVKGATDALRTAQEEFDTSVQLRIARDNALQALETSRAAEQVASSQLDLVVNGTRSEVLQAAAAALAQTNSA